MRHASTKKSALTNSIFEEILVIDKTVTTKKATENHVIFLGSVKSWILEGFAPWTLTGDRQAT